MEDQLEPSIFSCSHAGWFFNGVIAAIHSFRGEMEQIIFGSSYSLRTATFFEDLSYTFDFFKVVYLFHHSNCCHLSLEVVVSVFLAEIMAVIHFQKYLFWQETLEPSIVWVILSAVKWLFPKKLVLVMRSSKGTIIISKQYSQPSSFSMVLYIFLMLKFAGYVLSAYFRKPVTVKQTSYQSSYIFRAWSIILKWQQLLLSNNYFLVTNTFSDQLLLEDNNFLSAAAI